MASAIRVVVDTNVLTSGFYADLRSYRHSPSQEIVRLLLIGTRLRLLLTDSVFDEYSDVLFRRKFGFDPHFIQDALQTLEENAFWIEPVTALHGIWEGLPLPDVSDEIFLECAIDGDADYLVTGNTAHYPDEDWIVTPREFLDEIQ